MEDLSVKEEYERLKKQWKLDTRYMSSISMMLSTSSAQMIISRPQKFLPYIFEDLKNEESSMSFMISAFPQMLSNPPQIPEEMRGYIDEIRKFYLNWWEEHKNDADLIPAYFYGKGPGKTCRS